MTTYKITVSNPDSEIVAEYEIPVTADGRIDYEDLEADIPSSEEILDEIERSAALPPKKG